MKKTALTALLLFAAAGYAEEGFHIYKSPGVTWTPKIPGQEWIVHQKDRPQPPRVKPAPYPGMTPAPSDAILLFDGTSLNKLNTKCPVVDGALRVSGGISSKDAFGDCQLHIEWRTPTEINTNKINNSGNSGIFLMGKYEIQVFDSYSVELYADGSAAAVYGQTPPMFNVCRKPGEWQTYDIFFKAPVFDEETLVTPAYVTVMHNGVFVHVNTEITGPTKHNKALLYEAHEPRRPFWIQAHGSPVEYRNIWIRDLGK
ncbi:3-keto-disaccharide hydrolase [Pontiella agarivorans]|uniref:DUF1080 domain-containing protein n=1 Tax=Pontiella agarivorans TaxID=3038953 RepID=A0ABU5N0V0_9BACT|nr:DUF1080 domain-containing protein [Pontiella agarivorans]MDZ8120060.1 DUF1080 domain-containing protein [Pontiella agarivorans]